MEDYTDILDIDLIDQLNNKNYDQLYFLDYQNDMEDPIKTKKKLDKALKNIVNLSLINKTMSDETFAILCDKLSNCQNLQNLGIYHDFDEDSIELFYRSMALNPNINNINLTLYLKRPLYIPPLPDQKYGFCSAQYSY